MEAPNDSPTSPFTLEEIIRVWKTLDQHEGVGVRINIQTAYRRGKLLIWAKDLVPHGQWIMFAEDTLGINRKTAARYVKIAVATAEKRAALRRIDDIYQAEKTGGEILDRVAKDHPIPPKGNRPPKAPLPPRPSPVYSCVLGTNADLIRDVARLYLRPGQRVLDLTYGRGSFWRHVIKDDYEFTASDLYTSAWMAGVEKHDFKNTSYPADHFDVAVLDPWYLCSVTSSASNDQHKQMKTYRQPEVLTTAELLADHYGAGMQEAWRVLRPGGLAWIKCQDTGNTWLHIDVLRVAEGIGFRAIDLFVLQQDRPPIPIRPNTTQRAARKNHSYLWVLKKTKKTSHHEPTRGGRDEEPKDAARHQHVTRPDDLRLLDERPGRTGGAGDGF